MKAIALAEGGLLPDAVIRAGMRRLLATRLAREAVAADAPEAWNERIARLDGSPIATAADKANEQHYEVPAGYFQQVLGPRLKYSACLWRDRGATLSEAEDAMLALTAERAGIENGQRILELGCGWGSLTLWLAERYPDCRITAVSNAASQRAYIESCCRRLGFDNVDARTADINTFAADGVFDRIVSVEMFEHARNYRRLFQRLAAWLADDGQVFVHVFCHGRYPYLFEDAGPGDWMARHFFTGGTMPSEALFAVFQDDLRLERLWRVNGSHYARTLLAWLHRHDAAREPILALFREVYGAADAQTWFHRWRLFYLACAELFGYGRGTEWYVAHYLFSKRRTS